MREIILDTETTGLDPKRGDRLIELACVEMVNRIPSGRFLHELVDPQREVPREAEQIHGISTDMLRGKPLFQDIALKFIEFIGDAPLIIHNAPFDMGFLNAELRKACFSPLDNERVVDTLVIARRRFPGSPSSLDALCKRFKIDNSKRTKHGALLDSELLADVYVELMGGHQTAMSLDAAEAAGPGAATAAMPIAAKARLRPRPLVPRLTPAELEAHGAFVGTLKNPLWTGGTT
jgi:DNA polymerase III subunit epsilon